MTLELSAETIAAALRAAGVPADAIFLGDDFYAVLTRDDVQNKFAREFTAIKEQMGFVYQAESRDCDDFARAAAFWMGDFNAENGSESGLAFGEVWCREMEHAFNWAIHQDADGKLRVAFYEPQASERGFSMEELKLTQLQIASINHLWT